MSKELLEELLTFLKPEIRLDLKHISLDHLVGLSGSEEGIKTLLENNQLIERIIELTDDRIEEIANLSLMILVNVSAHAFGGTELLKYRPMCKNIIELFIGYILDPMKVDADACCMILSNITRLENEIDECLNAFVPKLNDILNVYVNTEFNKKGCNLDYLGPMFCNLSRSHRIRKWLIEENPHIPLIKLLPFCNYQRSTTRRGGTIGIIRNLSFDTELHSFLLNNDLDLLAYILSPLMGNEEYADDEMDQLPLSLQYLPKEKTRETDTDLRMMIVETLNKLCATKHGRETLRENGVYYILREYHKWEKDQKALVACENVVDILIQKEEEVGAEDLSAVEVPDELKDKFNKMDHDYLNM